jgi:hypothetical protein
MHPSKVVTADGRYLVVDPEETRKFPSQRPYYHPSRNPGPFVPVSRIESSQHCSTIEITKGTCVWLGTNEFPWFSSMTINGTSMVSLEQVLVYFRRGTTRCGGIDFSKPTRDVISNFINVDVEIDP